MTDPSGSPDPLGNLAEEFVDRFRRGERPSITEYCQQHIELAPRIRELFPSLVMLEQLGPGLEGLPDTLLFSTDGQRHHSPVCVGDYQILAEIGRGGMGIVYEAVQQSLGRRVALKVLSPHAAANAKSLERFRSEARAAARLHHTNIVPVFEVGLDRGYSFIAMQRIHGQGLDSVLADLHRARSAARSPGHPIAALKISTMPRAVPSEATADETDPITKREDLHGEETPQDPSGNFDSSPRDYFHRVAQMGMQIAEGLDYAHHRGVIHRDIKPSNLLLDASGVVWITDFGLAKTEEDAHTLTGDIVGTLRYMAPERFGGRSDRRSDVYGLGTTLYELLTLQPAFDAHERVQLIQQVMRNEPPGPRQIDPRIPRDLETIVLKAIDREPSARYASAGQMADDLRRFLSDQPILARRSWLWERTWRWCVRNPAVASLTALTLLVFCVGLSGVVWKWREAEQARQDERLAREAADASAQEVRQGLLRLKQANALLDLGEVCVNNHRWDDADAAFAKALQLRPDHVQASELRGHLLYARLGLWELAAADLATAFQLQQPIVAGRWWNHALLRVYLDDTEGYRRVSDAMQERFGRSFVAHNSTDLIRARALLPALSGMDKGSVELAESVVTSNPQNGMFLYVLAIGKCRLGAYEEAIQRCRESIDSVPDWPAKALNYPILAIAYHHLGQDDEARLYLELSDRAMSDWTRQMYQNGSEPWVSSLNATGYWPISCWDWLECRIYQREARRLLAVEPGADPRLHVLRARGFAGLRKLFKADEEYALALQLSPADTLVQLESHRNRAYLFIHKKDLHLAAAEFAQASQLAPDDSDLLRFQAFAHAGAGEVDAYRQVCRQMVDRFKDTQDRGVAYDVVDACVVQPNSLEDMSELIPLARRGATWYVGGVRILGAAWCRAGDFAAAADCYQQASQLTRLSARDWGFLAIARHQLGQADEARRCLAAAADWVAAANREELDDLSGTRPIWGGWYEPIEVPKLLQEARAVVDQESSLAPATKTSSPQ